MVIQGDESCGGSRAGRREPAGVQRANRDSRVDDLGVVRACAVGHAVEVLVSEVPADRERHREDDAQANPTTA